MIHIKIAPIYPSGWHCRQHSCLLSSNTRPHLHTNRHIYTYICVYMNTYSKIYTCHFRIPDSLAAGTLTVCNPTQLSKQPALLRCTAGHFTNCSSSTNVYIFYAHILFCIKKSTYIFSAHTYTYFNILVNWHLPQICNSSAERLITNLPLL